MTRIVQNQIETVEATPVLAFEVAEGKQRWRAGS
jgi:hypothetical protein